MRISMWTVAVLALAGLVTAETTVKEEFSGKSPGKDWKLSSKTWTLIDGELVGAGSGYLEYGPALAGDFVLSFEAQTEEKANIEVQLVDRQGKAVFTFAFLGQYHSVLDGVKCCILKENRFVHVNPRLWIYPGRKFHFEVRRARRQYQMFLNRELAGVFVDAEPPGNVDELRLRITYAPEGTKDRLHLDNVQLAVTK